MPSWASACQTPLASTISQSLCKFTSIASVLLSNHLILCCTLLLLPSIFSRIRVFSNELTHHIRWPNYRSFCFTISPSNEYSGFTSFRSDWFDLLAVQGTPKSLLQHHNSKASVLQRCLLYGSTLTCMTTSNSCQSLTSRFCSFFTHNVLVLNCLP